MNRAALDAAEELKTPCGAWFPSRCMIRKKSTLPSVISRSTSGIRVLDSSRASNVNDTCDDERGPRDESRRSPPRRPDVPPVPPPMAQARVFARETTPRTIVSPRAQLCPKTPPASIPAPRRGGIEGAGPTTTRNQPGTSPQGPRGSFRFPRKRSSGQLSGRRTRAPAPAVLPPGERLGGQRGEDQRTHRRENGQRLSALGLR